MNGVEPAPIFSISSTHIIIATRFQLDNTSFRDTADWQFEAAPVASLALRHCLLNIISHHLSLNIAAKSFRAKKLLLFGTSSA